MKITKIIILWMAGVLFIAGCGKPVDPEELPTEPDNSGGYKRADTIPTSGYAQDIVKRDNLLYIAQGEGGLMIVDVSDPLNGETLSVTTENLEGYSYELAIRDSLIYIAAGSNGIFVVDIIDPYEPYWIPITLTSNVSVKNVYVKGNFLFNSIGEHGVSIYNLTDPYDPIYLGDVQTPGSGHDVTITSDTNYLIAACGELGLSMFNISEFQQGINTFVGSCDTPGYAEEIELSADESFAFLACGTAGLQIIDISDTANFHITGSYDGGGYAKSLKLKGTLVYMATELSGLQVIDVSDVSNPSLAGTIDTEFAMGLEVDDDYVYVADEDEGVLIIAIPD
ncbi:MAG: hypothetical protein FJY07_11485 [Bacteroidetes bacterium]|nr:hypothetical protein [Bacteroidota bacterium]